MDNYKSTLWTRINYRDCTLVQTIVGPDPDYPQPRGWRIKGPGFSTRQFNLSRAGNVYWRSTGLRSDKYGEGIIIDGFKR
jgi:hypothetical protein